MTLNPEDSASMAEEDYFFSCSDEGAGGTVFSPLRLVTACRRMYSIWPFTLRSSACAQPSSSSQSAGSMRRRNDFRSAISYQLFPFVIRYLRIQRAGVHHRMHFRFAAQHHHQIADHGGAALIVKVHH